MNDFRSALDAASSGMRAQSTRLRTVAENIANSDTPGYRRKTVSFEAQMERARGTGGVAPGPVRLDQRPLEKIYDPAHPMADAEGQYEGSNVDLLIEIADSREAGRGYEANLKMFDQVKQMSQSLLDLLRK